MHLPSSRRRNLGAKSRVSSKHQVPHLEGAVYAQLRLVHRLICNCHMRRTSLLFAICRLLFVILRMPRIVRFHEVGDADVLKLEELPKPQPKEGEVLLRVEAIGLNRAEVMFRSGRYLYQPKFPSLLGYEAAGIVDAVGPGVTGLKPGDRVSSIPSFSLTEYGTYGEYAVLPAHALTPYPANLSPVEGTSIWMQYLTAYGVVEFGGLKEGQHLLV